ncbi:hypothetical protein A3D71_00380 [Candidatus Kaiserbacteria bacterium RIFCSPHIGHO2_02_FULL_55_20]|uniref:Uncharacterized protein n=1 Tax=Candidatus Kaiserbacteria bacterium RIFCSPHIGHO2_02_FULL_55_20 TaxID=1798497 RepID=A0A1F6DVX9_9BACT|nr:MAG: hypothetical protein A2680_03995 [Candidatus Kaiserbacteria bacterium RIFCSPHIGHO2_01_FULL_55_37]OGG65543.1 MAG: hypothetical protein A3D71_00380 [Candidatus Kaiserbacteria bacterium RIFCSPHIGHO2_02_FULL_55_20]
MAFRLTRRFSLLALLLALTVLVVLAFAWQAREHDRLAAAYFSDALTKAGIPAADSDALRALRLAYARAAAQRFPLLGLPGVDPDALERAVGELEKSQKLTAAVQATSSDATLVPSLYPVTFLATLPVLERARRQFIASPSEANLRLYEDRQRASIAAQETDVRSFDSSLKQVLTTSFSISGLGGFITSDALFAGVANVDERIREVQAQLAERSACFAGAFERCDSADIAVPALPDSLPSSAMSESARSRAVEIRSLLQKMLQAPMPRTVVLSSSFCLGALPGPYAFVERPGIPNVMPAFINEMFFRLIDADTKGRLSYFSYIGSTYRLKLLRVDPMMFYMCPTVGSDVGRIRALEKIDAFAVAHPTIAAAEQALLRSSAELREDYAVAYLRAALAETAGPAEQDHGNLVELALMYEDRSAGLDEIILSIASINAYHATLVRRGVPFDVSVRTLFLTHSAYPTLFLAQNPSAGGATVSVQSPSAAARDLVLRNYRAYSSLRATMSQDDLIREIRAFVKSESNASDI